MARRWKRAQHKHHGDLELQITSLADILMVVLVFLLKSFASPVESIENLNLPAGLQLPNVQMGGIAENGYKIEISQSEVSIEGEHIADLTDYRFSKEDLNQDLANGGTSKALIEALRRSRGPAATPEQAESNAPGEKDAIPDVWILADQRAPYKTIQTVMASAALAGYSRFKLAVDKKQE